MQGCIAAHQLSSSACNKRRSLFFFFTNDITTLQHGVQRQPRTGEEGGPAGGPGGAEETRDRCRPGLLSAEILSPPHHRTNRSHHTDRTHRQGN